eukprot:COSAG05_NODE_2992_length_2430_cov_19.061776_6_plen_84_part_00
MLSAYYCRQAQAAELLRTKLRHDGSLHTWWRRTLALGLLVLPPEEELLPVNLLGAGVYRSVYCTWMPHRHARGIRDRYIRERG